MYTLMILQADFHTHRKTEDAPFVTGLLSAKKEIFSARIMLFDYYDINTHKRFEYGAQMYTVRRVKTG